MNHAAGFATKCSAAASDSCSLRCPVRIVLKSAEVANDAAANAPPATAVFRSIPEPGQTARQALPRKP